MGATRLFSAGLHGALKLLPSGYAAKVARKIKSELAGYGDHAQAFASSAGPILLSGLEWRGAAPDISILEPETIAFIEQTLQPGDVYWDIGANIGVYAVFAAKRGARRVFAFEPFLATCLQLQRNIVANKVDDRVVAFNMAIASATSVGELALSSFEPGVTSTLTGYELKSLRHGPRIGTQHVLAINPVDLVAHIPDAAPDVVKIDVDGAETLVLDGLRPLLPRIKSLSIEIEPEFEHRFVTEYGGAIRDAGLVPLPQPANATGRNRQFVRRS